MATYMSATLHNPPHLFLGEDTSDCIPSTLFSRDPEDLDSLDCWYASIPNFEESGSAHTSQTFVVETSDEEDLIETQRILLIRDQYPSPPYTGSKLQRSLPLRGDCELMTMDDSSCKDLPVHGLLPQLRPPSHNAFFASQPPSPPLDTPELVQRSLPAPHNLPSPPLSSHLSMRDLPDVCDVDMVDAEDNDFSQPSTSRLCHHATQVEGKLSSYKRPPGRWPDATHSNGDSEMELCTSATSTPTTTFHHPELLTPETPTVSWFPASPPPFPEDTMEYIDDFEYPDSMSDWPDDRRPGPYDEFSRPSKYRRRSLEPPEPNSFLSTSPGPSFSHPTRAFTTPAQFITPRSHNDLDTLWAMDDDDDDAPRSPHSPTSQLPDCDPQSQTFLDKHLLFQLDETPLGMSPLGKREPLSLPEIFDEASVISPSSPRAFTTRLPELEIDDLLEPPSSPRSPHCALEPLDDDDMFSPPQTVAPAFLGPPVSEEGLGLFIQPSGIDPPLARSPSPEDDDLGFLDIQLDSACSPLQLDEFLQLRALRRRVLDSERNAREYEADLAERVSLASEALLPGRAVSNAEEKRARKYELHVAMEMRDEAHKARKRMKQRNKEIGSLLDLKMDRSVQQGRFAMRNVAQLVANMVLKRRDVYRPLAHRKPASAERSLTPSPLRDSISVHEQLENDGPC